MKNTIFAIFKIKLYRVHISVALLSVLLVLLTGCSNEVKDSNVLLKKAVTLASKDGKWKEALKYAAQAVNADPQNANALVMYALTLEHDNQKNKAKKELRKAIKISPMNFMAQFSLGRFLFAEKDYEGAYEYLTTPTKFNQKI